LEEEIKDLKSLLNSYKNNKSQQEIQEKFQQNQTNAEKVDKELNESCKKCLTNIENKKEEKVLVEAAKEAIKKLLQREGIVLSNQENEKITNINNIQDFINVLGDLHNQEVIEKINGINLEKETQISNEKFLSSIEPLPKEANSGTNYFL
jgi:hypothetical protein